MTQPPESQQPTDAAQGERAAWRSRPLAPYPGGRNPWLVFLLPFVVFMLVGSLEPARPDPETGEERPPRIDLGIRYRHYPLVYTAKIVLTVAAIALVLPGYRQFPFRLSPLAVAVGLIGGAVWIGLCSLHLESRLLQLVGAGSGLGERSAFNPLEELADRPAWAYGFLAIRFFGLVVVVSVIEEFFLRGFVMRYLEDEDWWAVPFGEVDRDAIIAGTVVPMLMHPGELIAAAVWFSAVTWLMIRTKNIWDCVAAHALTNLVLGLYVVSTGEWWLM